MRRPTAAVADARGTFRRLSEAHPDAHCELVHESAFQLIVATVLSAQSTDVAVNLVTPGLFARYGTPEALAKADPEEVQRLIGRLGMFRQKAKNIIGLAQKIVAEHGGEVPRSLAELILLPGVGRKTANVVLGVAFHAPEGVVVDTHVQRLTQRLGWTSETTPEKIEPAMMAIFPREEWDLFSHVLIFHGRRVCFARKPACATCTVNDVCPSAFKAEEIGRKNGPSRAGKIPATKVAPAAQSSSAKSSRTKSTRGQSSSTAKAKATVSRTASGSTPRRVKKKPTPNRASRTTPQPRRK